MNRLVEREVDHVNAVLLSVFGTDTIPYHIDIFISIYPWAAINDTNRLLTSVSRSTLKHYNLGRKPISTVLHQKNEKYKKMADPATASEPAAEPQPSVTPASGATRQSQRASQKVSKDMINAMAQDTNERGALLEATESRSRKSVKRVIAQKAMEDNENKAVRYEGETENPVLRVFHTIRDAYIRTVIEKPCIMCCVFMGLYVFCTIMWIVSTSGAPIQPFTIPEDFLPGRERPAKHLDGYRYSTEAADGIHPAITKPITNLNVDTLNSMTMAFFPAGKYDAAEAVQQPTDDMPGEKMGEIYTPKNVSCCSNCNIVC